MPPVGAYVSPFRTISERFTVDPNARGRATVRPSAPKRFRFVQGVQGVNPPRRRQLRRAVTQDERDHLTGANREFADGGEFLATKRHDSTQHGQHGSGDRTETAIFETLNPGHH